MPDRHSVVCGVRLDDEVHHGHEDYRSARAFAVNPCAFSAPFGLRGIDSSARPSKRGHHAMNAVIHLVSAMRQINIRLFDVI